MTYTKLGEMPSLGEGSSGVYTIYLIQYLLEQIVEVYDKN